MNWCDGIPYIAENGSSPRVENGILYWNEGDTFSYCMEFELIDQDKEPIDLNDENDTLTITFYNRKNQLIKQFVFGKENSTDILNNSVMMSFDAECSALFEKSTPDPEPYWYEVILSGSDRTTLVSHAPCVVM